MTQLPLSADLIAETNARHEQALEEDYGALGRKLARSGIDIAAVQDRVAAFSVAVPSWGAGRAARALPSSRLPGSRPTSMKSWKIAP
jgi:L-rhamnose isomerase/sugar isomerase